MAPHTKIISASVGCRPLISIHERLPRVLVLNIVTLIHVTINMNSDNNRNKNKGNNNKEENTASPNKHKTNANSRVKT